MADDATHKPLDGPHSSSNATTATAATSSQSQSHLHYVRATSAIDGDGSSKRAPPDYVARRWALWEAPAGVTTPAELGAIARLPLPLQVAFRRKMLCIFLLQLLLVGAVVGVFLFHAPAQRVAERAFGRGCQGFVALAFFVGVALLAALYALRNRFPLNWLLLLLFSAAQCACFVGLGVAADTNVGFFNCAFTFACVVIMTALAGVSRRKRRSLATPEEEQGAHEQEEALLSSFYAGVLAYVAVAAVSTVLFLALGRDLVTDVGFGGTLAFQLLLMLWFASDAAAMYRVMTPDEYMHGVIYFYTDLILLAIAACVAVATVAACALFCSDGGADCSGCLYVGYCPCYCDGGHARDRPSDEEDDGGAMHRV